MFHEVTRFGSKVQIFEYHPDKNPSQIIKADQKRKPLKDFEHSYYRKNDYKEIAKINLTTFKTSDLSSIHYGWLYWDSGHEANTPTERMTECYLTKDNKFVVESDESVRHPEEKWWGVSLLYALVADGKKNLFNAEKYYHAKGKHSRSLIGQKVDGTMVLVRAEALTADESAELMIELGCMNAINCDGGGSAQLEVNGKHYGAHRPLGTVLAVFAKEDDIPSPKKDGEDKMPLLVLDPGHGDHDPGAAANGIVEKDLALEIALKVRKELTANYEVNVRMTRDDDTFVSLSDRADFANDIGADYFVSLHHNAFNQQAEGFETFVYPGTRNGRTGEMQDHIHNEVMAFLKDYGVHDRGKKEANFAVLRETNMPAILIENLFVDHGYDARLLNDQKFIDGLVKVTARGIAKAMGLKGKEVQAPAELYRVQVGAFSNARNAEKLARELQEKGYQTIIKKGE
jgi:N-acetylmuramoyl-L-alanine amidase